MILSLTVGVAIVVLSIVFASLYLLNRAVDKADR